MILKTRMVIMRKFGINHNVSDKYTLVVKLKNNDAVSKCASLLIEKKDRHFNQHRLRKIFQLSRIIGESMSRSRRSGASV